MRALAPYPSYRYEERQTFSRVPGHWDIVRARHLVRIRTGSGDTVDAEPDGTFPFYVRSDKPLLTDKWEFDTTAVLTAGDGAGVAKVFHLVSGQFMAHQRVYVLDEFRRVIPRFFYYAFSNLFHLMALDGSAKSTVDSVRRPMIADMPFAVPSLEEQCAIADYLDRETARIDTLIEEQQRLIVMLRERRVATIAARLASFGGMTRLKHVSTVQTGVTLSGEGDPAAPEWPYLRVANVQVGYVDRREIKTVRVPPDRAQASMLQPGDVLMTEGGDIDKLGRGALWRGEVPNMLHQNHIFAVRSNGAIDPEFLVYWLDGPVARTYFRTTAKQTTNLAGTNKWTLGNLPVPVPPMVDQRRSVSALDEQTAKIDALIAETERFVELARERRAALITAAVTGQIDVREMV